MALPLYGIKPEYVIDVAIRRRWFLIIPFCIFMLIGSYLAITLPKNYEAKTLILVEPQRVPANFVRSVVSTDIDSRISTISQQILSRTNLEKIIEDHNLFFGEEYEDMFMEDKLTNLRKRISVKVTRDHRSGADAFSITFKWKEPATVMRVANALASFFIDENLKVREAQAIGTSDFLDDELRSMRAKLEGVEEHLKQYRESYMGELPEQLETNLRILDRLQEQIADRQLNLREEKNRLSIIENQIKISQERSDVGGPLEIRSGQPISSIASLKSELERLRTRYTDRHPDVVSLRKRISELEMEKTPVLEISQEAVSQPDEVNSIANTDLDRQRREIINEIASLEAETKKLRSQIIFYQKRVENTPKREQELLSLKRDYDNIQAAYNSLLNRKLEAEISVNMEKKQKGERFRILDSARLPQKPVEPNMFRLFIFFCGAGISIGCGVIFLFEYFDTSLSKPEEVESYLGLPVLSTIPVIYQSKDKLRRRFRLLFDYLAVLFSFLLFIGFAALVFVGIDPMIEEVNKYIDIKSMFN